MTPRCEYTWGSKLSSGECNMEFFLILSFIIPIVEFPSEVSFIGDEYTWGSRLPVELAQANFFL
jgi:hypothetical protein